MTLAKVAEGILPVRRPMHLVLNPTCVLHVERETLLHGSVSPSTELTLLFGLVWSPWFLFKVGSTKENEQETQKMKRAMVSFLKPHSSSCGGVVSRNVYSLLDYRYRYIPLPFAVATASHRIFRQCAEEKNHSTGTVIAIVSKGLSCARFW
jgi:hypothetical protein